MGFYYGILLILLMVGWAHIITSFFYKTSISSTKNLALDGLRGLLALGVFVAHSAISYRYYRGNAWLLPKENFYAMAGEGAVIFFFMITGFLFWNMIIRYRGELNPMIFVQHRILRLLPMFIFSFMLIEVVAFSFNEQLKFVINGGVYWTLDYEWKFYLIVLVLAFLYRKLFKYWVWLPLVLLFIGMMTLKESSIWFIFPFGMLAASIKYKLDLYDIKPSNIQKLLLNSLSIPFLIFIITQFHDGYNLLWYALGFILFLLIVCEYVDFFGVLHWKAMVLLGSISYSFYLLHAIGLYIGLNIIKRYVDFNHLGLNEYWLIIAILGLGIVTASTFTYHFIEEKFYKLRTKMDLPIQ
jgi:peptidoglycan/LPS O-acetylase OafA/YrhL